VRAALAAAILFATPAFGAEVGVGGKELLVDGRPFLARGVAGSHRMGELKALGATTVRTYGEPPDRALAEAARHGLYVIVGFWLEHPRRGFDYANRNTVEAQLAALRAMVLRHRDHPALLLWGIGNEVEAELADDAQVWPAIEEAARLVKALDPKHATIAVVGEVGQQQARKIKALCPSIDVLGVNAYGDGLMSLAARVRAQGWHGPLIATEVGALGQWQAGKTAWGAALEPTSSDKAARLRRYLAALEADTVGQLLFLWGHKQEVTPSWHSLLLPSGEWTEPVEAMAERWRGATPGGNRAPRIHSLQLAGGAATLEAEDPDGDPLAAEWRVLQESTDLRKAGDTEAVPADHSAAVRDAGLRGARVDGLPPGHYRLFVTLRDGRGAAATGNLPFRVP
jgi:hypothetical protein